MLLYIYDTVLIVLFADTGVPGSDDLRLLSVHVVVRHGDRSPLHSIPNIVNQPFDCRLNPSQFDARVNLTVFMREMDRVGNVRSTGNYTGYSLYPAEEHCGPGELTQSGVEQQVLTGAFLREAYVVKHKLFVTDDNIFGEQVS